MAAAIKKYYNALPDEKLSVAELVVANGIMKTRGVSWPMPPKNKEMSYYV